MKRTFLKHLDTTDGQWSVTVDRAEGEEIVTGFLSRQDGKVVYPIIDGIPRLLTGQWLDKCLAEHGEYARRFGDRFPRSHAAQPPREDLKTRTVANFSYQWKHFNRMLPVYEENHRLYFRPKGPEFFAGRIGLDAGCGTGRHVFYAAKYGAEMVAIDLSDAVETAYNNTRGLDRVHVAQADIYSLPFRREHFDFVESIGVIHILPDPRAAVDGLLPLLKPGGDLYVYVYSAASIMAKTKGEAFKLGLRRGYEAIGRTLPPRLLNAYCFAAAAAGRAWNVPWRGLASVSATRALASRMIAFKSYEMYPIYVLHTDLFDWIGTPLNRYLTREELQLLYEGGPYQCVDILDAAPFWRVFAKKAATSDVRFSFERPAVRT